MATKTTQNTNKKENGMNILDKMQHIKAENEKEEKEQRRAEWIRAIATANALAPKQTEEIEHELWALTKAICDRLATAALKEAAALMADPKTKKPESIVNEQAIRCVSRAMMEAIGCHKRIAKEKQNILIEAFAMAPEEINDPRGEDGFWYEQFHRKEV